MNNQRSNDLLKDLLKGCILAIFAAVVGLGLSMLANQTAAAGTSASCWKRGSVSAEVVADAPALNTGYRRWGNAENRYN